MKRMRGASLPILFLPQPRCNKTALASAADGRGRIGAAKEQAALGRAGRMAGLGDVGKWVFVWGGGVSVGFGADPLRCLIPLTYRPFTGDDGLIRVCRPFNCPQRRQPGRKRNVRSSNIDPKIDLQDSQPPSSPARLLKRPNTYLIVQPSVASTWPRSRV